MGKNLLFTSEDLMNRWGINAPTLAQYIDDEELPVLNLSKELPVDVPAYLRGTVQVGPKGWKYANKGWGDLYPKNTPLERIIDQLPNLVFRREDVLEFEAKPGLKVDEERKALLPCKPGTKWEYVTMTLFPSEKKGEEPLIRIKAPEGEGPYSYQLLEMHHKQNPSKPKMMWKLLKLFAEHGGFISGANYNPSLVSDHKKLLDKHLRSIFGIGETIYAGHAKALKGHKTKINFRSEVYRPTIEVEVKGEMTRFAEATAKRDDMEDALIDEIDSSRRKS